MFYINRNGSVIEEVYCHFESIEFETCDDYAATGTNVSGYYYVYVDGYTFQVYCEFAEGKITKK